MPLLTEKRLLEVCFKVIHIFDKLGELSGRIVAWLIIPLVASLTYEVVARYGFGAPTVWAYDAAYMLYGSLFMLGAAYTLRVNGHIRTDIFYSRFSPRKKAWIDLICYLFLFFPGMLFFFLASVEAAVHSWIILERSDYSPWRPPIYPFKTVIPLTALLLVLQGLSEFLKSLQTVLQGDSHEP